MGDLLGSFGEDVVEIFEGHSQSSRTIDKIIRRAAREVSVLDNGSTGVGGRMSVGELAALEPLRKRWVKLCRKGVLWPSRDGRGED